MIAIVLVGLTIGLLYLGITNVRDVRGDTGAEAVADGGEPNDD